MRFSKTDYLSDLNGTASGVLSFQARRIFEIVNCVFVSNAVCLFGLISNSINLAVFSKQGFHSTMNISFFGLAISDLCSLLALLWFNVCVNPLFEGSGLSLDPAEVQHLTACSPHNCFSRITGFITVFITAERCLCITLPLKVKQIITPRRTVFTIGTIYILMMVSYVPEFASVYIDMKFYPSKNKTLFGLAFTSNRESMEGLAFILYAILGTISFLAVFILTVLLVFNLKRKAKWRQESTFDNKQSEIISNRDKKTVNMVIMIATVLIVCYSPGIFISTAMFVWSEFSVIGREVNVFMVTWSFAFLSEAINSSVNILMYYRLSSRYRKTFHELFLRCCRARRTDIGGDRSYTDTTQVVTETSHY